MKLHLRRRPCGRNATVPYGTFPGGRGFTLIELMVTIAVVAILALVAYPSFSDMRRNSQLSASVNSLLAAVNTTRAEALRTQGSTRMAPLGANWASGWRIYTDTNGNNTYDAGTDSLIAEHAALPDSVTLVTASTTLSAIRFTGDGYPRQTSGAFQSGSIQMTNGKRSRRLVMSVGGRVRICDPDASSGNTAGTPAC